MNSTILPKTFILTFSVLVSQFSIAADFTYRHLVSTTEKNGVNSSLSSECNDGIREHITSNKQFQAPLIQKLLIRFGDVDPNYRQNGFIYHYSKSQKMFDIASTRNYSEIFLYLRSEGRQTNMDWNLYFAGDPKSSKGYGPVLVKVQLKDSALVFDPLMEYTQVDSQYEDYSRKIYSDIEDELIQQNRNLQACKFTNKTSVDNIPILVLLALEDSGVSLIAYYGLTTPQSESPVYDQNYNVIKKTPYVWYQLIFPDDIVGFEAENAE